VGLLADAAVSCDLRGSITGRPTSAHFSTGTAPASALRDAILSDSAAGAVHLDIEGDAAPLDHAENEPAPWTSASEVVP
jgi:hypothetical protein